MFATDVDPQGQYESRDAEDGKSKVTVVGIGPLVCKNEELLEIDGA